MTRTEIMALRERETRRISRVSGWRASRLSKDSKPPGWFNRRAQERIEQSTTALAYAQRDPRFAGMSLGPMEKHEPEAVEAPRRTTYDQIREAQFINRVREKKNAAARIAPAPAPVR